MGSSIALRELGGDVLVTGDTSSRFEINHRKSRGELDRFLK